MVAVSSTQPWLASRTRLPASPAASGAPSCCPTATSSGTGPAEPEAAGFPAFDSMTTAFRSAPSAYSRPASLACGAARVAHQVLRRPQQHAGGDATPSQFRRAGGGTGLAWRAHCPGATPSDSVWPSSSSSCCFQAVREAALQAVSAIFCWSGGRASSTSAPTTSGLLLTRAASPSSSSGCSIASASFSCNACSLAGRR